jgi:phage FluMu gp28-like protein
MHEKTTRLHAKSLFRQGWQLAGIAAEVGVAERTLRLWRDAEGWAVQLAPEEALEARIVYLVNRADKSDAEYTELERLIDALNRLERGKARALKEAGRQASVEVPAGDDSGPVRRGKKARQKTNEIGHIDLARVEGPPLFAYQKEIVEDPARFIFWRKSRQIGATTHTIAWKALRRAIGLGHDQIFLSASNRQAQVFNRSIRKLAGAHLGLELSGSKERIQIHRGGQAWAAFIFLSTNSATAQSESGDVYVDEAFWIPRFAELERVASGMATLKQYTKFYASSVSTVTHPAWRLWVGETGKDGKARPDAIKRITTTVHDAIAGGNDLIDVEVLKAEYSEEAFAQLFLCRPIDDEQSVFKLAQLERCQSDPAAWGPAGGAPVWLGYDPSRSRDYACLAVLARVGKQERFRLLECLRWQNKNFRWQAERIREAFARYNVQRIGIDVTGMGQAVYELVREFFPRVTAIHYSLETKTELVLKARQLIEDGRFEYEAGDQFVTGSFLAIKQAGTDAGRVTYKAGRSAETGHAEAFWAVAHALHFEPLRQRRRVVIG